MIYVPFISYFRLLVFGRCYQKTKISAVKFVYSFFQLLKTSFNWENFVDWPIRNSFSQQKVNIKKIDSWYFGLLVAIYQKPKDKNMRWTGHFSNFCAPTENVNFKLILMEFCWILLIMIFGLNILKTFKFPKWLWLAWI